MASDKVIQAAPGGSIVIQAGDGGPGGPGGSIVIRAGDAGPDGPGGSVLIRAGDGAGSMDAEQAVPSGISVQGQLVLPEPDSPTTQRKIPAKDRTAPMSFRRAAKLMGKGNSQDAAEWLAACVRDGSIPCEHITRQSHVFSRLDFPREVWPQIVPKST